MSRRWTKAEDLLLLNSMGCRGTAWFVRRLKRSASSINNRVARLTGDGSLRRGMYSVKRACEESGYTRSQLWRAQRALNQQWRRTGPRGAFLITEDQYMALVEWLRVDYWSKAKGRYSCLGCGTDTLPHRARGLCRRCFEKYRRQCYREGLPFAIRAQVGLLEGAISIKSDGVLESELRRAKRGWAVPLDALRRALCMS